MQAQERRVQRCAAAAFGVDAGLRSQDAWDAGDGESPPREQRAQTNGSNISQRAPRTARFSGDEWAFLAVSALPAEGGGGKVEEVPDP